MEKDPVVARAAKRASGRDPEPLVADAQRMLRAEMIRRGFSFKRLATALQALGDQPDESESVQALINKVNRGRFSFAFMLRACRAMGVRSLDLTPLSHTEMHRTEEKDS